MNKYLNTIKDQEKKIAFLEAKLAKEQDAYTARLDDLMRKCGEFRREAEHYKELAETHQRALQEAKLQVARARDNTKLLARDIHDSLNAHANIIRRLME